MLIFAGIFLVLIIGIIAVFVYVIVSNNSSSAKEIDKYIEEHYGDTDFEIVDAFNNFPVSRYLAKVESPSSPDSHFEIEHIYEGRIEDTYERDVLSGLNTFNRIEKAYEKLVAEAFESHPLNIEDGRIRGRYYHTQDVNEDDLFLYVGDLELDKEYDIHALGERHGQIDIDVSLTTEAQLESVAKLIMQVKEILDEEGVPFREVSLRVREVKEDNGKMVTYNDIKVYTVPYEQINEGALLPYLENIENESS